MLSAWSRCSSSFGRAGSSPLKTTNGRASAGMPPGCQTRLRKALRLCCWLLCKTSAAHGPSSGCGLGNVLPFGCSSTSVANLGCVKLFVYGGDDPCALASNASRETMGVESSPCGVVCLVSCSFSLFSFVTSVIICRHLFRFPLNIKGAVLAVFRQKKMLIISNEIIAKL